MEMLRFIQQLKHDKKKMFQVMAGFLILVIAFAVFLVKNHNTEEVLISDLNPNQNSTEEDDRKINSLKIGKTETEAAIFVDVAGAVVNPSVVRMEPGSRVFEALERAGGVTKDADTRNTNLARMINDGEKIYIPTTKEMESCGAAGNLAAAGNTDHQGSGLLNPNTALVNINMADSNTLQQLKGVGPSTADKIIQYRTENGNFQSIEDLKNVSGIGDKTFEKLKDQITV